MFGDNAPANRGAQALVPIRDAPKFRASHSRSSFWRGALESLSSYLSCLSAHFGVEPAPHPQTVGVLQTEWMTEGFGPINHGLHLPVTAAVIVIQNRFQHVFALENFCARHAH